MPEAIGYILAKYWPTNRSKQLPKWWMLRAFNGEGKFVQQRVRSSSINVSPILLPLFYRVQRQIQIQILFTLPSLCHCSSNFVGRPDRQRSVLVFRFWQDSSFLQRFSLFLGFHVRQRFPNAQVLNEVSNSDRAFSL